MFIGIVPIKMYIFTLKIRLGCSSGRNLIVQRRSCCVHTGCVLLGRPPWLLRHRDQTTRGGEPPDCKIYQLIQNPICCTMNILTTLL